MTDHPFSAQQIDQARAVLRPHLSGADLDVVMTHVAEVARTYSLDVIETAKSVIGLMTPKPRKVIVVAPTYNQAALYLAAIEAQRGTHLIAVDPTMVRALSADDHVVVVSDHDPGDRLRSYTDHLRTTQARVEYVSLDSVAGVSRG